MWKFKKYSANHILREINFGDFKLPKNTILTVLEAKNVYFGEFVQFIIADIGLNQHSKPF